MHKTVMELPDGSFRMFGFTLGLLNNFKIMNNGILKSENGGKDCGINNFDLRSEF